MENEGKRTYKIIGAVIEVHKELWRGFLEVLYSVKQFDGVFFITYMHCIVKKDDGFY